MDKQTLLQTVSQPDEKLLLAKVINQAVFCEKRHTPTFTNFLDRTKCEKFLQLLQPHIQVLAFGGVPDSERCMLGFAPDYYALTTEEFPISILKVTKHQKFGQTDLTHRDYLGSLLGLGIDRSKIGDIFVQEQDTYCMVHKELSAYIVQQLQKVSKTPVQVTEITQSALALKQTIKEQRFTVASLRLDAMIAGAFHLSRGKVQSLITSEKVTINWSICTHASHMLQQCDIVSVRGFGRFRFLEISGKSKKDRIGVVIGIYT